LGMISRDTKVTMVLMIRVNILQQQKKKKED
jgi:hypothetical protein